MSHTTPESSTSPKPADLIETATAAEPARKSGKGRGCVFGCLGIFLILIAIPVISFLIWSSSAKKKVAERLDAIRAQGEPSTIVELEAFYALREGAEDTTDLWIHACEPFETDEYFAAVEDLPIVGISTGEIPPPGEQWEHLEGVENSLQRYKQSMDLMHKAAEKGGSARFDLPFDKGFAMPVDRVQQLRAGARMLVLEAHARAHRGDVAGTMESLRSLFTIGRALERDPVLVSQLVQIALDGVAVGTMLKLLPYVEFDDGQLAELQTLVRRPDYKSAMKTGILGERVLGIDAFQHPNKFGGQAAPKMRISPMNEDLYLYVDLMTRLADSLDGSWLDAMQTGTQLEQELKEKSTSIFDLLRYFYTAHFLPATGAAISAGARETATMSLADVMLASERYHRAHNKYPDNIQQLVPEYLPAVPIDPFDGNPVRYELRNGAPVVWSIGQNQVDDSGVGDDSGMQDFEFKDIVLTLAPSENDTP